MRGSNQKRHGLRKPQAQISGRGGASDPSSGEPGAAGQAVAAEVPASGLSAGTDPSKFTRRILPFAFDRQVAKWFEGSWGARGERRS